MLFFVDLCGPREPCVMWGPGSPDWKGAVLQGHNWACIYWPVVNILSLTEQQQCGFCCCIVDDDVLERTFCQWRRVFSLAALTTRSRSCSSSPRYELNLLVIHCQSNSSWALDCFHICATDYFSRRSVSNRLASWEISLVKFPGIFGNLLLNFWKFPSESFWKFSVTYLFPLSAVYRKCRRNQQENTHTHTPI